MLKKELKALLQDGTVIPAHPLALDVNRKLDAVRQCALTKYYLASGAGGIAVGVHTTQFEIRDKKHDLFHSVLQLAAEEVGKAGLNKPFIKIAGITGPTEQALQEAETAVALGYDMGLLSMGGLNNWSEEALLERAKKVAEVIPVFGFYLQPAVGGQLLSYDFWKTFAEIPQVHAIKMAPFNRYQTLDVVRAVCNAYRYKDIALYTGNDDNIIVDLLTTYRFHVNGELREKSIVGGLLGHWAVWTQKAVELLEEIKNIKKEKKGIPAEMLTRSIAVTDTNAAFFDAAHNFKGCIAGIHEVLRRQGLLVGNWCLNPMEDLSPGQSEEISRVYQAYPELHDDAFVKKNLKNWIAVFCAVTALCFGLLGCQKHEKGKTISNNPSQENTNFPKEIVAFIPYKSNPLFTGTQQDTWDKKIRERGYILPEAGIYKLWYTGYRGEDNDPKYLGYATSKDGIHWERYGEQPIFDEKWTEDMMVIKDHDQYYMYAEGKGDIAHLLISADGIHWEEQGDLEIFQTNGEPISSGPFGTPTVWIEKGIWYLFYERNDEAIWVATSDGNPRVWKNRQDAPVVEKGPEDYDKGAVAANQIVKFKDKYYMYYHASSNPDWQASGAEWSSNVAMSTDLVHWVKYSHNPIVKGDYSSPILVPDQNGVYRLYTMHDEVRLYLPGKSTE